MPDWQLESQLFARGYSPVAGIDEAGRGALAGPVVVAAVVLPYAPSYPFDDSKRLSAAQRERLADAVRECALVWALGAASADEIDRLNVLRATHLAAVRALAQLGGVRALVTDYLKLSFAGPVVAPPRADQQSYQVAAASILAKTARDAAMRDYEHDFPHYGFAAHKGYGSAQHRDALARYGACSLHRRSFRPVYELTHQHRLFGARP
ncbi:MAG: ribonuclease HII [Trueperaceae bacterium]|nr:ribonuclease HII [Trueperaceae bacterium]